MKTILLVTIATVLISGCSAVYTPAPVSNNPAEDDIETDLACQGVTQLPPVHSAYLIPIEDDSLLSRAFGKPEQGGLCQGQVYQSTASIRLYRAWNSTNPNSRLGSWWAFEQPQGNVATYREEYEICYQWSPLDMLVTCSLKAGTKVVVGNGQSARCSDYLIYPVSPKQQVFIAEPADSVENCEVAIGEFKWKSM